MNNNPKKKASIYRILIGFLSSGIAILFIINLIDIKEVKTLLSTASYKNLPWVILCFFGTMFARSMSWKTVLNHKISFSRSFWALNQGYILNNFLPFRLGELGRAVSLNITENIPVVKGITSILIDRIFDITILGGILLVSFPIMIGSNWQAFAPWWLFILLIVGILTLFLIIKFPEIVKSIISKLFSKENKFTNFIATKAISILDEIATFTNQGILFQVSGWMTLAWLFNIAWYAFLLTSFIENVTLLNAAFIMSVASLGVAIPSTPGYIGIFEGTVASAFALLAIDAEIGLAFAIAAHLVYFIITSTLGAFALAKDGFSILEMYQNIRSEQ
jgi:glycosyltransferase 2 family protein